MKTPKTTKTASATATYTARHAEILSMLDLLKAELEQHAMRQTLEHKNWGFVGDLEAVKNSLSDAFEAINEWTAD